MHVVITNDGFFQEELPLGIEDEYEEEQTIWLQTLSQFRMQIFRIRIKTLGETVFKISAKEMLETVVFILFTPALGGKH